MLQYKQCVLVHITMNGLRHLGFILIKNSTTTQKNSGSAVIFTGKFQSSSTVFQKIVKIFSEFYAEI